MNTALRSSDILEMKISNIDFKNRVIRIKEKKTKKEKEDANRIHQCNNSEYTKMLRREESYV